MTSQPVAVGSRAALQTAADILVSPNAAYARLRKTPTWVIAALIAIAISAAAALIATPALIHAAGSATTAAQLTHNPNIAKLPPDQQADAIARVVGIQTTALHFAWIISPVFVMIVVLIQSVVMLAANVAGRGDANFHRLWSLAMNVQIAGSIGALVNSLIVTVRGANTFERASDIQSAVPNLSLFAFGAPETVTSALSAVNVSVIWQSALLGLGMVAMARISRVPAWATVALMVLTLVAFAAWPAISRAS